MTARKSLDKTKNRAVIDLAYNLHLQHASLAC